MLDFINVASKLTKNGFVIYPKFLIKKLRPYDSWGRLLCNLDQ